MLDKKSSWPALIMTAVIWGIFGGFIATALSRILVRVIAHELGFKFDDMMQEMNWTNLEKLTSRDEIKFVINSRNDYDWAVKVLYDYQLYKRNVVLFSPVYQKMTPRELAEWILQDNLPVRFQSQLHKALRGETPWR